MSYVEYREQQDCICSVVLAAEYPEYILVPEDGHRGKGHPNSTEFSLAQEKPCSQDLGSDKGSSLSAGFFSVPLPFSIASQSPENYLQISGVW